MVKLPAKENGRINDQVKARREVLDDMETMHFGTDKISPLYRYIPNRKDLPITDKSLLVTLPYPIFNSIVAEIVRWNDTIRNVGVNSTLLER